MACLLQGQGRPDKPVSSSLSLEVSAHQLGQTCVLCLAGDLDVTSAEQLRAVIVDTLVHRPRVLVLDLSGVEYADCRSLSVMVWAHHGLDSKGRQLYVAGSHGAVRRLIEVTGFDKVLRLIEAFPVLDE